MRNETAAIPSRIRCAIYTRKSTEEGLEQEFNSLDAQREAAEAYIKSQKHLGWVLAPKHYDDGGFSGGSLERPALQQLLEDIDARRIDCVVVYKVDRLSRSLLDFARLMDRFDQGSVSFVSVTQQFNTTTSLGRLTLNILLSFAQFERELISERTRDKMSAARRKGKWVGGVPLLGYDVHPAGGRLVVNEKEAERVRAIFDLYCELRSLPKVVTELAKRRWTTKSYTSTSKIHHAGQPFHQKSLLFHLTHAIYVGKVEYKGETFDGEHAAIVDRQVWEEVNQELRAKRRVEPNAKWTRQSALLSGLLYCGSCDVPMIIAHAKKQTRRYRYYLCSRAKKEGWAACSTKSAPAHRLEESVKEQLRIALADPAPRATLYIKDTDWKEFLESQPDSFIRGVVKRISYSGRTGSVVLDLKPFTSESK